MSIWSEKAENAMPEQSGIQTQKSIKRIKGSYTMKSKTWNIGFIGAGTIARKHATDFVTLGRSELKAVADLNPKAAEKFAADFHIPKIYTDYKLILKDPSIDAVVIGTPPFTHCKIFLDAVKSGKHIMVEKPVAIKHSDLVAMTKATASHKNQVILEASCRHARLQPKYDFVKKLIDSGALGQVYHIHHNAVSRLGRPGIESNAAAGWWFLSKKYAGGGPSFDWGVYDLSFHMGILGDKYNLQKVCAASKRGLDAKGRAIPHFDVEEHFAAMLTFDKGLTYYWERSTNAHNRTENETRIYGTKAGLTLRYTSWEPPEVTMYDITKDGKARERILPVPMKGHNDDNRPLITHFMDCMEKKAKPLMPIAIAAKHVDIILRVLEAAK
jgi:predicted dehydrogenase